VPSVTLIRYFYPNISGWPWPLGSQEVITQRVSPAIFNIIGPTYWCHELDLTRSRDVIDRMTIHVAICYFLLVSHWNRASIFNRFQGINASKYIWITTLTCQGHVTLLFTWPFDPRSHFLCSIVTDSVSKAIFKIMIILNMALDTE